MTMTLTFSAIQPLLDQFTGAGMVASCYADLSLVAGTPSRWPGAIKAKVTAIKKILHDDPVAWQDFEKNYQAIGAVMDSPEMRHAPSVAAFSASQRGFFRAYPLDVPVRPELVLHAAPYLVPLLEILCRQLRFLVVHTDTHQGRLYSATPGSVHLLSELVADVPKHQHSAGQRWGMEQATIARHRDECIVRYQKNLTEAIDKEWAADSYHGIVLLGEHEQLEHLRKRLPPRIGQRVVHEDALAWVEEPTSITDAVEAALVDVAERADARVIDEIEQRRRQGYAIATGPRGVVDALQSGRLRPGGFGYIALGPDPRETIARCTACRSLFVEMPASCPRCQAPCADASLWEEILIMALKHGITVHCLEANDELRACGGIAAVLAGGEPGK
jgi:hypothetical protein